MRTRPLLLLMMIPAIVVSDAFGQLAPIPADIAARRMGDFTLEDKPLSERDRRRYESRLGTRSKRAGADRSAAGQQEALKLLEEGEVHLAFDQQLKAAEVFQQAWAALSADWKTSPEKAARDIRQLRKHFAFMGQTVNRNPPLAAALLTRTASAQRACLEAIGANRTAPLLVGPLSELWFAVLDQAPVSPEARDAGTWWVLEAPQAALSDRVLPPPMAARYERELADNASDWNTLRRQAQESHLREMQRIPGQPLGPPGGLTGPEGQALDPALRAREAALQEKRPVMYRFMEIQIHIRYGQYRKAVAAAEDAWAELLRSYQEIPATPFDADIYLETVDDSVRTHPLRAAVLMFLLDPPHRKATGPLPILVPRLAERWAAVCQKVELRGPMAACAAWWIEEASRRVPEFATAHAGALESLKTGPAVPPGTDSSGDSRSAGRAQTNQDRSGRKANR